MARAMHPIWANSKIGVEIGERWGKDMTGSNLPLLRSNLPLVGRNLPCQQIDTFKSLKNSGLIVGIWIAV